MTPDELLAAARDLVETPRPSTTGTWPRAAALLGRQALEACIDDVWRSRRDTAGLVKCSMATQLRCLRRLVDPDVAAEAAHVWAALSNALHHHAYELLPTAGEITRWLDQAAMVAARLADLVDGGTQTVAVGCRQSGGDA